MQVEIWSDIAFVELLERAWSESHHWTLVAGGHDGSTCDGDACAPLPAVTGSS